MPTSKTIYEAFDGTEFIDEEDAKAYEKHVRKCGAQLREKFFSCMGPLDYLPSIEPKLLELIKSYPDDEAWRIMRSLKAAKEHMSQNCDDVGNLGWLEYLYDNEEDV